MKTNLTPASSFKYSLRWAATVVDELWAKYPRASEMICRVYGIGRYDLVKYLAKPDTMYVYLRERIKYLALCEQRLGRQMEYSTVVEWCGLLKGTKHAHGLTERLDKREKELKLREQGSRGGGGCSEAKAEPSLPNAFPPSPPLDPEQYILDFGG